MTRVVVFVGCTLLLAGGASLTARQFATASGDATRVHARDSAPQIESRPAAPDSSHATIQGYALTASDEPLGQANVRLRDARTGRVLGSATTDNAGLFVFRAIDPGLYVVELIGRDRSVLAVSELLTADAGDVILAVVKLPSRKPPAIGLLGHRTAAAIALSAAAAASGVLAIVASNPPVSGER